MASKIAARRGDFRRRGRRLDNLWLSSQGCASGIEIPPAESVVQDKRVHPRVVVDTLVSCEVRDAAAFEGMAKDISIGGMFVESPRVLAFGTEITIVGRFPGAKADLRLPGIVRWSKPTGFGIQFGSLGARETHAISELLKR
jgi:type IV pilus assembly protein PilZ